MSQQRIPRTGRRSVHVVPTVVCIVSVGLAVVGVPPAAAAPSPAAGPSTVPIVGPPATAGARTAAAASRRPTTLRGRLPKDRGALGRQLPGTVLALRLAAGGGQVATVPGRNRRYRLVVTPGFYGVVTTAWRSRRAVTDAHLVRARRGHASVVRTRSVRSSGAGARVAVGPVRGPANVDLRSMLQAEVMSEADSASCDVDVILGRDDPVYQALLDELNLQTTENFPPEAQAAARATLEAQAALTPQYRIEADVTALGTEYSGASSGTFRLVQVATGEVVYEETLSYDDAGSRVLFATAAKVMSRVMCDVPTALAGTVNAVVTAPETGQRWQWDATVAFVIEDGGEQPDGTFQVTYTLSELDIGSIVYTVPPDALCTEARGTWSGSPDVRFGTLTLTIAADGTRTYTFAIGGKTPEVTVALSCDGEDRSYTAPLALGAWSGPDRPWFGPTFAGTFTGPYVPEIGMELVLEASWDLRTVQPGS